LVTNAPLIESGVRSCWNVGCDVATVDVFATTCQLYVGHEGDHAAVVLVENEKLLRRWSDPLNVSDTEFTATKAASLPWAPGQPTVEHAEAIEDKPNLAVVVDNPDVVQTPKTADLHIA
jgi:hypothetical protein